MHAFEQVTYTVAVPLEGSATSSGSKDMMSIRGLNARGAVNKTTLIELGFVVEHIECNISLPRKI